MATSQESQASQKFIAEQKELFGRFLAIDKIIDPLRVGVADIEATFKGMPIFAESKWINQFTHINKEPFKVPQINFLRKRALAGAMCFGLLLNKDEPRIIMWDQLQPHITPEQFLSAEILDWEILRLRWTQNILINF